MKAKSHYSLPAALLTAGFLLNGCGPSASYQGGAPAIAPGTAANGTTSYSTTATTAGFTTAYTGDTSAPDSTAAQTAPAANPPATNPPAPATNPPAPATNPPAPVTEPPALADNDVRRYADLLNDLLAQYGEPEIRHGDQQREYLDYLTWFGGLFVNLFDMDNDGIPELYAAYNDLAENGKLASNGTGYSWIYTLSNGVPKKIYTGEVYIQADDVYHLVVRNTATNEYLLLTDAYINPSVMVKSGDAIVTSQNYIARYAQNNEPFAGIVGSTVADAATDIVLPLETEAGNSKTLRNFGYPEWCFGDEVEFAQNATNAQSTIKKILG